MHLLVHVEGQTEETFVDEVLAPHLYNNHNYHSVKACLIGNSRLRQNRGGIRPWISARNEIIKHLRENPKLVVTTMVDYYGLPSTGSRSWPGRDKANELPFAQKASHIEKELIKDIASILGDSFNSNRFVPYIVMHEFEGLLFSDCSAFSKSISHPELESSLKNIRNSFDTPEEINDSPDTAPSKRIIGLIPNYEKPIFGVFGILSIGLDTIRNECTHFNKWLTSLENLPKKL